MMKDCGSFPNEGRAIIVIGRYVKQARDLSQSPWLIENRRLLGMSVEEAIAIPLQFLLQAQKYKFISAGREDADVRMLGSGRPFAIEFFDCMRSPSFLHDFFKTHLQNVFQKQQQKDENRESPQKDQKWQLEKPDQVEQRKPLENEEFGKPEKEQKEILKRGQRKEQNKEKDATLNLQNQKEEDEKLKQQKPSQKEAEKEELKFQSEEKEDEPEKMDKEEEDVLQGVYRNRKKRMLSKATFCPLRKAAAGSAARVSAGQINSEVEKSDVYAARRSCSLDSGTRYREKRIGSVVTFREKRGGCCVEDRACVKRVKVQSESKTGCQCSICFSMLRTSMAKRSSPSRHLQPSRFLPLCPFFFLSELQEQPKGREGRHKLLVSTGQSVRQLLARILPAGWSLAPTLSSSLAAALHASEPTRSAAETLIKVAPMKQPSPTQGSLDKQSGNEKGRSDEALSSGAEKTSNEETSARYSWKSRNRSKSLETTISFSTQVKTCECLAGETYEIEGPGSVQTCLVQSSSGVANTDFTTKTAEMAESRFGPAVISTAKTERDKAHTTTDVDPRASRVSDALNGIASVVVWGLRVLVQPPPGPQNRRTNIAKQIRLALQYGAEEKVKRYEALVYAEHPITPQTLSQLQRQIHQECVQNQDQPVQHHFSQSLQQECIQQEGQPLQQACMQNEGQQRMGGSTEESGLLVFQRTPLRVLHRRSLAERLRRIYAAEFLYLHPHLFLCRLDTQAGTYVKEFVHGDNGRTKPSLSSLLNNRCYVLLLDVVRIVWGVSQSEQQQSKLLEQQ